MHSRTRAATIGLALPAVMALALSADTSYRFLGTQLGITEQTERLALCGTAEVALVALSVYSWAARSRAAAWLAYVVVLVQAVPAFAVSDAFGGGVFRATVGPGLLTVLLHLLLGLELKMSGSRSESLLSRAAREARERLVAYLGLGRRGADSADIARSRAADRAVVLSDALSAARTGTRAHRKLTARLARSIDAARHGLDREAADAAEQEIIDRVRRWKSVGALARLEGRHEWIPSEPENDPLANAASLLAHEPPEWASMTKREAVAKADRVLPGLSGSELSKALAEVGVEISADSIRSHRSALRTKGVTPGP